MEQFISFYRRTEEKTRQQRQLRVRDQVRRFESSLGHSGGQQLGDNGHLARPRNDSQGFSGLHSTIADQVLVGSNTQRDTHHADNRLGGAAERARAASYQALDVLVKTRIRDDRTELAASAQHIVAYARQVSDFLSLLPPSLHLALLHSRQLR